MIYEGLYLKDLEQVLGIYKVLCKFLLFLYFLTNSNHKKKMTRKNKIVYGGPALFKLLF